jgi:acyl-CoA synthetase (NDP forming)
MQTLSSIRDFADARSVAIIGASARKESWGYSMTERLIGAGYKGAIQLVNRGGGEILGHRVSRSVDAIPGEVDLALATLGNEQIFEIVEACVKKGVRGLIVYTAGFAEVGEQGLELQKQVVGLARDGGMRVIGPNCNGLFNARLGLNLTGRGLFHLCRRVAISVCGGSARPLNAKSG